MSDDHVRDPQPTAGPVLAFDIGGTRAKAGLVDAGRVRALATATTGGCRSAAQLLDRVEQLGRTLVGSSGQVPGVGISVRGVVEPGTGVLLDVNEPLACLAGTALGATIGERFGAPAWVDNDARMYALGELWHGAGQGSANLVCLTLGTGVGVGVVADGRLLRGPRGTWGILGGHVTVQVGGPPCSCGNAGCLEALIGAEALVTQVRARLAAGEPSRLAAAGLDAARIFGAAGAGDDLARRVVDRFARVLGCGIVTMIHIYDPDVVVVGGGLAASAPQFLPAVHAWVSEHAWTRPRGRVHVRVAELGDAAALVGAARLAVEQARQAGREVPAQ